MQNSLQRGGIFRFYKGGFEIMYFSTNKISRNSESGGDVNE